MDQGLLVTGCLRPASSGLLTDHPLLSVIGRVEGLDCAGSLTLNELYARARSEDHVLSGEALMGVTASVRVAMWHTSKAACRLIGEQERRGRSEYLLGSGSRRDERVDYSISPGCSSPPTPSPPEPS